MVQKTHKNIKPTGGYLIDTPDPRNYSYGSIFGVPAYPRKFLRTLPDINIPYQGRVQSCVSCSFTWLNQYKSLLNDNNNLNLSWRKVHASTGAYGIGRNLKIIAKYLESAGQPQDQFCEDNPLLDEAEFMKVILSQEGNEDALKRIIGSYWWVKPDSIDELCSAVVAEPIIITLGGINKDWQKPYGEIVTQSNGSDWYHAIVLLGYDLDAGYFQGLNWWGDGLRKININYKLTSALSFRDIPDKNDMFKVIKLEDKDDQYMITGNVKRRIPDSDTFHYFKGILGIINDPVVVSEQELNQYVVGEMLPSVKLTRALGGIAKDIYFEE